VVTGSDKDGDGVHVQVAHDRPTLWAGLMSLLHGLWASWSSAGTGLPPAHACPEPNTRWRAVQRRGGTTVQAGDWRYQRADAELDAQRLRDGTVRNQAEG
jgi:hypothetical protein